MFDILEVLFLRTEQYRDDAGRPKDPVTALRDALGADFEVEAHEFVAENSFDRSRQVLRIIARTDEFESVAEFEARLRELADAKSFPLQRIGAVPVGETKTILG